MTLPELKDSLLVLHQGTIELEQLLHIAEKQERIASLVDQSSASDFWDDPEQAKNISTQLSNLQTQVNQWEQLHRETKELLELLDLEKDTITAETLGQFAEQYKLLQQAYDRLSFHTLFDGKYDQYNAIVSFHAGAGGTEAQDWASMLLRMIIRYSEAKEWKVMLLDESKGQEAGIKSATLRVVGPYAYGHLQAEHGTHRLVRISPFDAEAMRHTSFANIEVIPEIEGRGDVEIDPKELRIDTFMSSGKGGQSVNTTYSAVRVVHIPTGITVSCQNERSQQQNKETALKILQSKLQLLQDQEEEKKRQALRGEVKSAEWGNQIRSYVLHPYKMVKDVRTKYESSDPDKVLDGDLNPFIEEYLRYKKEQ